MMRTELAWFERNAFSLLLFAIILLLLVFVPGLGMRINGARRWIRLGFVGFQSVEAVKLLFIIYIASYLVRHENSVHGKLFGVVKPIGVAVVLVVLLLAQPDFGSAALIIGTSVGMVWLGGARMRNLFYLAVPAMPALAWAAMTQDYRVRRLTSFLNPWEHPFDDGFQLTQALIAIGRGEWFGVGLGASVQKLFYLPEAHTDFILAVIAEELGLAGIVLVLLLFAMLVGRAFMIGLKAVERGQRFAGYCAFGIALCIGMQTLVSIGVNLGVLPTKGLTLPLISSGGSSVLMTCVFVGFLLRISYEVSRAQAPADADVPCRRRRCAHEQRTDPHHGRRHGRTHFPGHRRRAGIAVAQCAGAVARQRGRPGNAARAESRFADRNARASAAFAAKAGAR